MAVIEVKYEKDWHLTLARAIRQARPGDTIECETLAMRELATRALSRKRPHKNPILLIFKES